MTIPGQGEANGVPSRKYLTRRDFLKISAAAVGALVGGPPLYRFLTATDQTQRTEATSASESTMRVYTIDQLLAMQAQPEEAQKVLDAVGTRFYGEGMKFDGGDTVLEIPLPQSGSNESHVLGFTGIASGNSGKGKGKGAEEGVQIQFQRREDTDPLAITTDISNNDLNSSQFVQREVGVGGNFIAVDSPLQPSSTPGYDEWLRFQMLDGSLKPGLVALSVSDKHAFLVLPQRSILDKNGIPLNLATRANIQKAILSFPGK